MSHSKDINFTLFESFVTDRFMYWPVHESIYFRVNTTRQFKGISSKLSAFSAIQNEMIEIDVAQIIKIILSETICFFSIIDETTDLSRHEQVSICVCYIDQQIMIKEKFIGFFRDRKMNSTTATALCDLILNILENLGLDYKTKLVGNVMMVLQI